MRKPNRGLSHASLSGSVEAMCAKLPRRHGLTVEIPDDRANAFGRRVRKADDADRWLRDDRRALSENVNEPLEGSRFPRSNEQKVYKCPFGWCPRNSRNAS